MKTSEFLFPILKNNASSEAPIPNLEKRFDNPICKACHERYKEKFPGKPFQIDCEGIASDEIIKEEADMAGLEFEKVKELVDPAFWASRHILISDANGELTPWEPRWYQSEMLRCTAKRKVDRLARGLGKTSIGVIEELHRATTKQGLDILIACPAKAQAQIWYEAILAHIENDSELHDSLKDKKQAPFFKFTFHNRSSISIFTTGTEAGREANSLRGQDPRRVRIDEQDYLNEGDYKAIFAFLRRHKGTEFHGSSTPTGKHETYWHMCTQFEDYREFYFPISVHPNWGSKELNEELCLREARTRANYEHEFLALFTDAVDGVFRSAFIDASRKDYKYSECQYDPDKHYVMGVDWNGRGTGTRVRIVSYDPKTTIRRCVAAVTIDEATSTTKKTIEILRSINRKWHCSAVYTDYGFGFVQDELLKSVGKNSGDPDDKVFLKSKTIDFGATLDINRLVPRRPERSKYLKVNKDEELTRRTKPFVVEGAVMALEEGLFEYSQEDTILDEQFRAYRVKNWSAGGLANTYECPPGDHDLTALMLALLGVEMEYGLLVKVEYKKKFSAISHITGIGIGAIPDSTEDGVVLTPDAKRKIIAGVPTRIPVRLRSIKETSQVNYAGQESLVVSPPGAKEYAATKFRNGGRPSSFRKDTSTGKGGIGSRTSMFLNGKGKVSPWSRTGR